MSIAVQIWESIDQIKWAQIGGVDEAMWLVFVSVIVAMVVGLEVFCGFELKLRFTVDPDKGDHVVWYWDGWSVIELTSWFRWQHDKTRLQKELSQWQTLKLMSTSAHMNGHCLYKGWIFDDPVNVDPQEPPTTIWVKFITMLRSHWHGQCATPIGIVQFINN